MLSSFDGCSPSNASTLPWVPSTSWSRSFQSGLGSFCQLSLFVWLLVFFQWSVFPLPFDCWPTLTSALIKLREFCQAGWVRWECFQSKRVPKTCCLSNWYFYFLSFSLEWSFWIPQGVFFLSLNKYCGVIVPILWFRLWGSIIWSGWVPVPAGGNEGRSVGGWTFHRLRSLPGVSWGTRGLCRCSTGIWMWRGVLNDEIDG